MMVMYCHEQRAHCCSAKQCQLLYKRHFIFYGREEHKIMVEVKIIR